MQISFPILHFFAVKSLSITQRSVSQDKAVLEPRVSSAFASTCFCNHCNIRFENASKYVDTLILFSKNLNQRSLTPTWPLTRCLLRSHVWLYPRIIVSKSHDNTSMYVDTVINFANYHTHTYILHTTYRMSDHIVSYWTQFRRDNYWTQLRRDKNAFKKIKNLSAFLRKTIGSNNSFTLIENNCRFLR